MTHFIVTVRNAVGREAVYDVIAATGETAAGRATRQAEREHGGRWYAVTANPR